ncbi:MAG: HmuY family protein [Treponema sp.]|nr:HmuY family protein [Treponema sp.]
MEPEDEAGGVVINASLPMVDGFGERHYYNLSSGKEVPAPSGDNWDIALETRDRSFFILTNSGVTAAETEPASGGKGGVWFTGSTDFDAVTRADQAVIPAAGGEYAAYTTDVYRWTTAMAAAPVRQNLNVTTYLGYPDLAKGYPKTGDGSGLDAANCFRRFDVTEMTADYSPYLFNKKQSYLMGGGMPPEYSPTKQVYIVRHGDGVKYSKVQLSEIYREPGTTKTPSLFVAAVRHEPVE